jgi:RHS repeat-associated protein
VVDYAYDGAGRLTRVERDGAAVARFVYDAGGRRVRLSLANGVTTDYAYDASDRLLGLTTTRGATVLARFDYTLDAVGNRTAIDMELGGAPTSIEYGFDNAYRLTRETRSDGFEQTFAYDAVGNRIASRKTTLEPVGKSGRVREVTERTAYAYNANNQFVQAVTRGERTFGRGRWSFTLTVPTALAAYDYDKNGNTVGIRAWSRGEGLTRTEMWYDTLNRQLGWRKMRGRRGRTVASEVHTYAGAEWHRTSTTANSGDTTTFVYDGDNVVADMVGGGMSRMYVTPILDQNLSMVDVASSTPAAYYYSQDGLGSVRTLTDAKGAVQNAYDYTAFGIPTATTTSETVNNRYTYTGREASPVGGPMYYRYRHYYPGVGRFGRRDPIYTAGGVNVYAYVGNQPLNRIDPLGMKWIKKNCVEVDIELFTGEAYWWVGGGASVKGTRKVCDCCHSETGVVREGDYTAVSIEVGGSVGFGFGGKFVALGYRLEWTAKGPQLALDLKGKFIKECNRSSVKANPHADFHLDATLSGSAANFGGVGLEFGGKVHGEYGAELDKDEGSLYIAAGWEYGVWVKPKIGPVVVPIKVAGDESKERKAEWDLY